MTKESTFHTSSLWLASALDSQGIPLEAYHRKGNRIFFEFQISNEVEEIEQKFLNHSLSVNLFAFSMSLNRR